MRRRALVKPEPAVADGAKAWRAASPLPPSDPDPTGRALSWQRRRSANADKKRRHQGDACEPIPSSEVLLLRRRTALSSSTAHAIRRERTMTRALRLGHTPRPKPKWTAPKRWEARLNDVIAIASGDPRKSSGPRIEWR